MNAAVISMYVSRYVYFQCLSMGFAIVDCVYIYKRLGLEVIIICHMFRQHVLVHSGGLVLKSPSSNSSHSAESLILLRGARGKDILVYISKKII